MFSNYLSSIKDIEIFPIISLIIFFAIFIGLIVWIFKMDKGFIKKMSNLPLEENDNIKQESKNDEDQKK